jgi:hypothetical protein
VDGGGVNFDGGVSVPLGGFVGVCVSNGVEEGVYEGDGLVPDGIANIWVYKCKSPTRSRQAGGLGEKKEFLNG